MWRVKARVGIWASLSAASTLSVLLAVYFNIYNRQGPLAAYHALGLDQGDNILAAIISADVGIIFAAWGRWDMIVNSLCMSFIGGFLGHLLFPGVSRLPKQTLSLLLDDPLFFWYPTFTIFGMAALGAFAGAVLTQASQPQQHPEANPSA